MIDKIRVVELFAGVGGFRLGLEKASRKFETIWANQWEPGKKKQWAYECYVNHFGNNSNYTNEDIALMIDSVPEHDLLVGGFPCQDYSVARTNAKGINGKKGVLWWNILDIIKNSKPTFVLLENVDRLIKSPSSQSGRDFGIMLRTLNDVGYNVEWRVINAAEYGEVQRRKRIFIFAYKKEISKTLGFTNLKSVLLEKGFFINRFPILDSLNTSKVSKISIEKDYCDLFDVSDRFTSKFYNSGAMINGEVLSIEVEPKKIVSKSLGDIIEVESVNDKFFVEKSYDKFQYLKGSKKILRKKPNGDEYFYSEGSMSFPDSLLKPARTMLTSEGSVNRSTHVILDKITNRPRIITPLEAERINGFLDNWTNTGMPERFRYFCMGNALVVPLIEKIGKEILKIWKKIKNHE